MKRHATTAAQILAIAMIAGLPARAAAQRPTAQTVRLAEGVYAVLPASGPFAEANVLLVINDDDVVVVDSNLFPGAARTVIAELRKLTAKPVRYIINTHWHSDHHYGNATWLSEFPGAEIIQHAITRRDVIERDVPALDVNVKTNYPAAAARIRQALETGRTSAGAVVTDTMRADFTRLLAAYEDFIRDMGASRIVLGTLVITDSLVLHRGDRTIVVKYLGRGNTAGDLVVHLPRERVVATGDLVVHPIPFSFFSHLGEWPATLRALAQLDAAVIMPGHGELQRDWQYVDRLATLIDTTWTQVRAAVAAGAADLEAVRKQVDLTSFRDAFAGNSEQRRRQFNALFVTPATEAAYNELRPDSAGARR